MLTLKTFACTLHIYNVNNQALAVFASRSISIPEFRPCAGGAERPPGRPMRTAAIRATVHGFARLNGSAGLHVRPALTH
jgi:hypothetical protein